MSEKRKLPPNEAWDALERMALRDEAERVHALSDSELDKELAAKGIDPKALRARGAALAAKLRMAAPEPKAQPSAQVSRRARRGWVISLAAASFAAGAATVGIPAFVIPFARPQPVLPNRLEASTPSLQDQAADLRRFAKDACERRQWFDCGQALDAALLLDPPGEDSSEVRQLRRVIEDERRR
jgi:hypothetical protein